MGDLYDKTYKGPWLHAVGWVRSCGVLIAAGINQDQGGCREILGLQIGDTESEASWGAFLTELKRRGPLLTLLVNRYIKCTYFS